MANTTKKTGNTASKKATDEVLTQEPDVRESTTTETTKIVAKEIDPNQYITVKNGFQGKLVYKSPRTGEVFIWDEFGTEQEMELRELKNAKNSHKKFFSDNWFMFDEDWVIDYLGVKQYYKHALRIDNFDDIFTYPSDKLKKTLNQLSEGQKKSDAYRAKSLISDVTIDSLKAISVLEEALGVDLTDKER